MMVDTVAKSRGPGIDALHHQYQNDLAAFSAFQESPIAKALLAVYSNIKEDAAAEGAKPNAGIMAALQTSVAQHTPAWRAAYEGGRTGAH